MKRDHPKLGRAVIAMALASLVGVVGCQNQQTALTNPFLAPDRVPPPATRTLLPGTAQPYYPGDPLPAMQSRTNGVAEPGTGGWTLARSTPLAAPGPQVPIASTPDRTPEPGTSQPALAYSSEPSVTIPSDGDALRFVLPPPAPVMPTPTIATAPTPAAPAPSYLAAVPANSPVVPAIYNEPVYNPLPSAPAAISSPWRSPQIGQQNVAPGPSFAPQPAAQPIAVAPPPTAVGVPQSSPAALAPPSMGVRLRAVPSPPPDPIGSPTPRIRLPGYPPRQSVTGQAGGVQQAGYVATTAAAATGVVQTVQITPLPPMAFNRTPTVATVSSRDGFRPRGSMR